MKRSLGLAVLLILIVISSGAQATQPPEHRDLWATAWGSAFESAAAVTAYINYTAQIHANVVIPELRLRSDAYYSSSIEPPGTGVTPSPAGFDSLADLLSKAHSTVSHPRIEVHPWVVTFRIWTTIGGPPHMSPIEHIWYTHGPGGANDWTMLDSGEGYDAGGITNLDPGHPAVEDYLITVFMDMITRYDVDGFNLDYIRYPGTAWGYNPVAVARYNAEYGTSGNPDASEVRWCDWRRDQVSNLVKRLYLEIKSVKPWVKLGIAGWNTAGSGNSSYFQDWNKWMQKHWLDYCSPMTYTSNNSTFEGWMADAQGRQYGHHIYPLVDVSNSITGNVLPQINLVRQYSFPGVGLYAYQSIPDRTALKNALIASPDGPFVDAVAPIGMSWLDAPTKGYLKGNIRNGSGNAIYPATVNILGPDTTDKDSGTGFYGFSEVTPGVYDIEASAPGYQTVTQPVTITAGIVSDLDFVLPPDTTPPVITNVRAETIQATNAQIKWDTDEIATSQVDYGQVIPYGSQTPEDMAPVTSHVVQLIGLLPSTTYHYRVRSYDPARNMAETTYDYTFTTTAYDHPADIIIDNNDGSPTYSDSATSWFTGTGATDKYGINYRYGSGTTQNKWARFRPTINVAGNYKVYLWWNVGANRTTRAPAWMKWTGGSLAYANTADHQWGPIGLNQIDMQANGGAFRLLFSGIPFSVGTDKYLELTTAGVEQPPEVPTALNLIADAAKFVWQDPTPPSTPTNLTATALSASQIALSWSPSTDNVGVAGYRIYRGGIEVGTSGSTSYTDSGRTANTQYSYYVKAYDAENNLSGQSNTAGRYTLSAIPGSGSVTCDKLVDTWQASPTFTFTAVGGFGAGTIQNYKYAFNQNPTHSWTGFEPSWSTGTVAQTATSTGSWYFHVKGFNAEGIENGNYTYGPYKYDGTAPIISSLNDFGPYTDVTGQLHASWSGSDPETGVMEYEYAIGTDPENLGTWTSTGTGTSFTTTGLTLDSGTTYYVGVKGQNGVGTWSTTVISTGVTAADVMASIHEAKALADTKAVMLTDRVVSGDFGDFFYICENRNDEELGLVADPCAGIRVNGPSPDEGRFVNVSGILDTINGERVLTAPYTEDTDGPGAPGALFMINKSVGGAGVTDGVGLNNVGLKIAIAGQVYDGPSGYFLVGGTEDSPMVKVDASFLTTPPATGKNVVVTGFCSTEESGGVVTPVLIPRGDGDVAEYPVP